MANNCLVTKLKAVVDNKNLPFLTSWSFTSLKEGNVSMTIAPVSGKSIDMYVDGDATSQISASTEVTIEPNKNYQFNKASDIGSLNLRNFGSDYPDLKVLGKTNTALNLSFSGGIDASKFPSIDAEYTISTLFAETDNKSLLLQWLETHYITSLQMQNSFITYTLSEIAKVGTNRPNAFGIYDRGLSGNIEDFVAVRYNLGQTLGSFRCNYLSSTNNSVLFNNSSLDSSVTVTSFSWSNNGDNTVITLGSDTTTIHVNSDDTWTRIS